MIVDIFKKASSNQHALVRDKLYEDVNMLKRNWNHVTKQCASNWLYCLHFYIPASLSKHLNAILHGIFQCSKFQQASIPHLSAAYHLGWRNTSTKQYLRASWEPEAWIRALMIFMVEVGWWQAQSFHLSEEMNGYLWGSLWILIRTLLPTCFGAHPDGYSF